MSGEMTEVLTAIGGLTEAVTTLKKDFNNQSIATEKYREYIHQGNSKRDKDITTMELLLERITPLVENHDKIATSINDKYIHKLDEHHAKVSEIIAKEDMWKAIRTRLMEHGLKVILVAVIAFGLYFVGLEELAKKVIGP